VKHEDSDQRMLIRRKFELALEAFREVNSRMEPEDCDMSNFNERTSTEETPKQLETTLDTRPSQDTNPYADIKAPPVVRTKGSGKKPESVKASAPTRLEPELDEHGKPKGTRLCSNFNKIDGHNSRTCKKRQLAKQLLETHLKVYDNSKSIDKVKKCIKNLLAKQHIADEEVDDDEEILNTDDEDYEDETDVDEEFEDEEADEDGEADEDVEADEDGEANKDIEVDKDGEADEDGGETVARSGQVDTTHTEEPPAADAAGDGQGGVTVPVGINTCGICNKKEKHNSRTYPWKDEIL
jgi:hypothetical protein